MIASWNYVIDTLGLGTDRLPRESDFQLVLSREDLEEQLRGKIEDYRKYEKLREEKLVTVEAAKLKLAKAQNDHEREVEGKGLLTTQKYKCRRDQNSWWELTKFGGGSAAIGILSVGASVMTGGVAPLAILGAGAIGGGGALGTVSAIVYGKEVVKEESIDYEIERVKERLRTAKGEHEKVWEEYIVLEGMIEQCKQMIVQICEDSKNLTKQLNE